jgi:predicted site-specific integrase-resolvase
MKADFVGISGAAQALKLSEPTVRNAANRGRLPCIRDSVGRRMFRIEDLQEYRRATKRRRRRTTGSVVA